MAKALVFCEHSNKAPKKGTLELLSLAKNSGCEITSFAFGPDAKELGNAVAQYGATKLIACADDKLTNYNPEAFANTAAEIIKKEQPDFVFAPSTMLGRDLFPRVAAKLDTGVASDCTEIEISGSDVKLRS